MHHRLIGIDLDGTLLNSRGEISAANRAAITAAQRAGARIVPCTGRGWREAAPVLRDVPDLTTGVFITGAVVAEIESGQSIDFAVIEPHLALSLVEALHDEPEAVLVYREPALAGHDYLVTGRGQLSANTQWWFQVTGATVRFQRGVTADDLHHTLRVGMVASGARLPGLSQRLRATFGDQVQLHHFAALQRPDENDSVHVLEIFASGVDKWRGLSWLAHEHGIAPEQTAAIGDEINDLSMVRHAGCGIAMANAIEPLQAVSDHVVASNDEDGVAQALHQMIDGAW